MRDHKKTKRDPLSFDSFEVVEVKAVVGGSPSEMSGSSSSSAILGENRPNGSQNPSNMFPVFAALRKQGDAIQMQGERTDRVLGIFENQAKTLEHYGVSMKTQVAMLTVQGEILKQHSGALGKVMKDHQKLQDQVARVQKEVGKQGSVLEQHKTILEVMEGRMDKLWKGRRGHGKPKLRRSTRIEASRTPGARTRASGGKYQQVQCSFCDKTLSSSYIRQHKSKCPAQRPKPQESQ